MDNPGSAGHIFIGTIAKFSYNGVCFCFDNLASSLVSSIEYYNGNLTVITLNSVYKFERETNE